MGRGLGPTQQTILATLRERARPLSVLELVYTVHYGSPDGEDWGPRPPRAVEVSVRRATHALERRGAVRRGTLPGSYGDRALTVLWLPDGAPPEHLRDTAPRQRPELEAPLLEILRATTAIDVDQWFRNGDGVRGYGIPHYWAVEARRRALASWQRAYATPDDGGGVWVPYQRVARELRRRPGIGDVGDMYRGLCRTIARLEAQGFVQTRAGYRAVRTYHAIRCLARTGTHQTTDTGAPDGGYALPRAYGYAPGNSYARERPDAGTEAAG